MLKAVGKNAVGVPQTIILGLSRANTERLHANQPIPVRLRELDPSLPDLTVVLLAGETEDDLAEDLRSLGRVREMPARDDDYTPAAIDRANEEDA